MSTACVTGANRGIGLELCRQLKNKGFNIIGVCRSASPELHEIADEVIEGMDVSDEAVVDHLAEAVQEKIDLLINCAGLLEGTSLESLDFAAMEKQFQVNTLGPLRVVKALLGRLESGAKIVMITSRMGSIADNTSGGSYGYRASKAALNAASVSLARDLKSKGIAVGIVHPGYVRTDMTGHSGHIDPSESVEGILKRVDELIVKNSGTFWHQNGEVLPW